MRVKVAVMAAAIVAGCGPQVPDSGAGVGFNDYNSYVRGAQPAPQPAAPATGFDPAAASAAIDRASGRAPAVTNVPAVTVPAGTGNNNAGNSNDRPRGNAPAGIQETTSEMGYAASGTVSDEQDFQAVSARETIESDKARIARNRAQYQVDQPTALPQRSGDSGPNIVQFALSTSHPPGTQMYARSKMGFTNADRACARFSSPDLAQEAFLAAGGPEKDRKGLDPDGDGYACAWDPMPFRAALK